MEPERIALPEAGFSVSRVFFAAGHYRHPPAGVFQLRVVRRGSSYADIDLGQGMRRVFTRPGDVLLSRQDRDTGFRIDDSREVTLVEVHPDLVGALLASLGATLDDLDALTDRPFRAPVIAELCRELETVDAVEAAAGRSLLSAVVTLLVRQARARRLASPRRALSEQRLRAVIEFIDRNLASTITLDQLADVAQMQQRSFTNAFKRAMAMPAYQYILRRRLDRGVELLTGTDQPIADIAQQVGFAHQAHFTRLMRRLKGKTPAELRASRDEPIPRA